jgi:transposase
LVPSVTRTWAPRGQTPILRCAGRRSKISAISGICIAPKRKRIALYAKFYSNKNIKSPQVVRFLAQLLKHMRGHVVLLWDGGRCHQGAVVREFLHKHPKLHIERFPGYAPELNPDEFIWSLLKRALANGAPEDVHQLKRLLYPQFLRLRRSKKLLWSCIKASELSWG